MLDLIKNGCRFLAKKGQHNLIIMDPNEPLGTFLVRASTPVIAGNSSYFHEQLEPALPHVPGARISPPLIGSREMDDRGVA